MRKQVSFDSSVFEKWSKALPLIDPTNHYIRSYPELIDASKCLVEEFGERAIPMVAYLVYGWMPKILSYSRDTYQDDRIYRGVFAKTEEDALQVLDSIEYPPTNNAWVGMSKTLHFLNPEIFPIWDSKVAKVFGIPTTQMGKKEVYKNYLSFVSQNVNSSFVDPVRTEFKNVTGYHITKVRAVEFVLFVMGEH